MKRILSTALTVVTLSSMAVAQKPVPSPEQQVRQIFGKLSEAAEQGDVTTFNRYVSDNALFVGGDGHKVDTKQNIIEMFSRPVAKSEKSEKSMEKNRRVLRVKVQGENAIVIERIWHSNGKQMDTRLISTNVFAKHDQDWQLVTSIIDTE